MFLDLAEKRFRRVSARRELEIITLLDEQFLFINRRQAFFFQAGSTLFFFSGGILLFKDFSWPLTALFSSLSALTGFLLPLSLVRFLMKRRERALADQLPDFIKMVSGSLRAGLSVQEALRFAAREIPAPFSQELGLILKNIRL